MTESGRLCAFITKVRKGSLADTVGHLRPGIKTSTCIYFVCNLTDQILVVCDSGHRKT